MNSKTISVHNSKEFQPFSEGVEVSHFMKLKSNGDLNVPEAPIVDLTDLNISETLYCSYCNTGFLDQQQQRHHYKLDWHRYNLKLNLTNKKAVSEEKFQQLADLDDVSSISGSESESDTETEQSSTDVEAKDQISGERINHLITRRSRILFNTPSGQVISIHRCLFLNKKEEIPPDDRLLDTFKKLTTKNTWFIVMLGGGHFAAAIFKDGEPYLHKTFHCYTVRAKQGGSQSSKDNKGGSYAKSAGASLRRYNEQALTQHVQDLVKAWGPDINKCDLIFYRAVGRGNSSVLFSGSNPLLLRADPRVRNVPFTTRRPTFNEVKRVYTLLATAFVYDSSEMFLVEFTPTKATKAKEKEGKDNDESPETKEDKTENKEKSPKKIDRAKERPPPVRELPEIVQQLADFSSESDGSYIMELCEQEINFSNLREFEDTVPESHKLQKKRPKKKKKEIVETKDEITPEQSDFWNRIHGACELGEFDTLKEALENSGQFVSKEDALSIINQKNIEGRTILHKVSSESKGDIVRLLMLHGCDPCIKDKRAMTPYDLCPEKETRNVYRRFMGEFPDMYDYSKSHIPNALTDAIEQEIAEKKRAARKLKRQKEKEKKVLQEAQKKEEEEKQRFLQLSDREKCALAAERRMKLGQPTSTRCYFCAAFIVGKNYFEYDSYKFCSMPCLKDHRLKKQKS